jgi:pseudaminic acid biosynthesis-associated methylase
MCVERKLTTMADNPQRIIDSETAQIQEWRGSFGQEYSQRNNFSSAELDALYESKYGIKRSELNRRFLENVPRDASILEVGSNLGNQLLAVQKLGFTKLNGVEVQAEILKQAKLRLPSVTFVEGSALEIPYPTGNFDLIFTSSLLIHIAPSDLVRAINEIHRCSKTWIWGLEYYAPQMTEVPYRGHSNLLWKTDYTKLYLQTFPDLELVREERLPYVKDSNIDTMFLLRKTQK